MRGEKAQSVIEENREQLRELSQNIWKNPEGALHEKKASAWMISYLKGAGFEVEEEAYGIETAFRATWGSGHPVIGFLGEYDALPGLSQTVSTKKEGIEGLTHGHGCCHNLLGVAAAGAAIGLKAEMEERGLPGTVVYYGCPAEENLMGKPVMAVRGAFKELDVAITNHPAYSTEVSYGSSQGCRGFIVDFYGKPSHAGFAPEMGRSALDALELANTGINYLREHVPTDVRMHYVVRDGGKAPNIVPEHASGEYSVRAIDSSHIDDAFDRVKRIMEGAAMMTDTTCKITELGGCYPIVNNPVLVRAVHKCMKEVYFEPYTEEELAFAAELNATNPEKTREKKKEYGLSEEEPFLSGVREIGTYDIPGGFDVGDVSNIVPTVFFQNTAWPIGVVAHTWQTTACAGHPMAFKGSMYAAKVMALLGLDYIENTDLEKEVRKAFEEQMQGKEYHSYYEAVENK